MSFSLKNKLKKIVKIIKISLRVFVKSLIYKISGKEPILVLGDSHSEVFTRIKFKKKKFILISIPGATASGLSNPNLKSKTNVYNFFY